MTPANFAHAVTLYAEFLGEKNGMRLSHEDKESIRHAAYMAQARTEDRLGKKKLDGMAAVEWIKKYRQEFGVSLREAKDKWDSLIAAQAAR